MKIKASVAALSLLFAGSVFAYPNVVDGSSAENMSGGNAQPTTLDQRLTIIQKSLNNIMQMDFPGQIKALQQQIQTQQGEIQMLQHQLKVMKQQQKLQYQDLDQRIQGQSVTTPKVTDTPSISAATKAADQQVSPAEQDKQTYQSAYSLVTDRKYDDAITAFKGYLQVYQDKGAYSANAYYWLGELYAVKKQYDDAISSLNAVITKFPDSNKVPDAMLKLGVVENKKGDVASAKQWLNQVIQKYPESTSARLAQQTLTAIG